MEVDLAELRATLAARYPRENDHDQGETEEDECDHDESTCSMCGASTSCDQADRNGRHETVCPSGCEECEYKHPCQECGHDPACGHNYECDNCEEGVDDP